MIYFRPQGDIFISNYITQYSLIIELGLSRYHVSSSAISNINTSKYYQRSFPGNGRRDFSSRRGRIVVQFANMRDLNLKVGVFK